MEKNEIHIIYGTNPRNMVYDVLTQAHIAAKLRPGMHIGIKPNLVVAKPADSGATTSPQAVEGVIQYLQNNGIENITIMEGSWVGDSTKQAYKVCGYAAIAKKYNVHLVDLKDDQFSKKTVGDLELKICNQALTVDFLISMPVLKAHCQTLITCALKNMKGCIPDSEKRRFHSLGLHKPIAYINKALAPDLIVVDGMCGDLTFEEGGSPVQMDRIFLAMDPVLMDTYAASLLGYAKEEIDYITIAENIGVGSGDLSQAKIHEHHVEAKNNHTFQPSNRTRQLAAGRVTAQEACSACYGSLIHALQRMSENKTLQTVKQPIYIGQGFRGKERNGLGIGQCTSKCRQFVKGCPPAAKDIVDFLENPHFTPN